MSYKAMLFDFDGTLVDTHKANFLAYSAALKELYPESDYDEVELYNQIVSGANYKKFLPTVIRSNVSEEIMEEVARKKTKHYIQYASETRLNLEMVNKIKVARSTGIIIALVTSAKERNAIGILNFHKMHHLFDFEIFGDGIVHPKPEPDIYLKALKIIKMRNNEVQAYEDSLSGIKAAEAAGIDVEQVHWLN